LIAQKFPVKGGVFVENEKLVEVLDKLIERSERWSKDAEKRKDLNSSIFYEGQTKAFEEVKRMVKRDIDKYLHS
jgi:tryptophan synthase beta subunit